MKRGCNVPEPLNLHINSGRPDFLLLDAITSVSAQTIAGARDFSVSPPWLGIEALAQLGAFHVRYLTDFHKHAFLLKINRFVPPGPTIGEGTYLLQGRLISHSSDAYLYEVQAVRSGALEFSGEFLYGAVNYDDAFTESALHDHYLRIFRCLQNATENGCDAGGTPDSSAPLLR